MVQVNAEIISNNKIKKNYFEITLSAPQIAKVAVPGQFVNIKVADGIEPLLRRPLSIHKIGLQSSAFSRQSPKNTEIVMLYEVVGKGTEILARRRQGEFLDVIGPLGNGFHYPLSAKRYPLILVAGGMGTAPLVFLAEKIAYSVERIAYSKNKESKLSAIRYPLNAKVLIGAKTKTDILCEKEFEELGCEVKIATDDGSRGFRGYVSGLLRQDLSAKRYPCLSGRQALSAIYACGPTPMLKEISRMSLEYNIPAQLSLESHMACGVGACIGCVIKVKSQKSPPHYVAGPPRILAEKVNTDDGRRNTEYGYQRVCKEGPVFEAGQVIWD